MHLILKILKSQCSIIRLRTELLFLKKGNVDRRLQWWFLFYQLEIDSYQQLKGVFLCGLQ